MIKFLIIIIVYFFTVLLLLLQKRSDEGDYFWDHSIFVSWITGKIWADFDEILSRGIPQEGSSYILLATQVLDYYPGFFTIRQ